MVSSVLTPLPRGLLSYSHSPFSPPESRCADRSWLRSSIPWEFHLSDSPTFQNRRLEKEWLRAEFLVCLYCENDAAFSAETELDEITSKNITAVSKNPRLSFNAAFLLCDDTNNTEGVLSDRNSSGWSGRIPPELLRSWAGKLAWLECHSSKQVYLNTRGPCSRDKTR